MDIENKKHKRLVNEAIEKLEQIIDSEGDRYLSITISVGYSGSSVFVRPMLWPEDAEGEEKSEERK